MYIHILRMKLLLCAKIFRIYQKIVGWTRIFLLFILQFIVCQQQIHSVIISSKWCTLSNIFKKPPAASLYISFSYYQLNIKYFWNINELFSINRLLNLILSNNWENYSYSALSVFFFCTYDTEFAIIRKWKVTLCVRFYKLFVFVFMHFREV